MEHIADQSSDVKWKSDIKNIIPLEEIINNKIKSGLSFSDKKKKYSTSKILTVKEFINANPQNDWLEPHADIWLEWISNKLDSATSLN